MKKIVFLLLVLILSGTLFSCKQEKQRIFDYQDDAGKVQGVLSQNGEEYGVTLYFEKTEEGKRCRRIEYSSPESLSGLSFTLEGDQITAELSGIRIAYSYFEQEDVFRASRLFELSEEDIYEIRGSKNGTTAAYGKSENTVWQVMTDADGMPTEISYEDGEGNCVFTVEKISPFAKKLDK